MIITSQSRPQAYRRIVLAAVVGATFATTALILIVLTLPARAALALRVYLVVVGALIVIAAIRALVVRYPVLWRESFDPARSAPPPPPEAPARLRAIYRLISRAQWDPAGFDLELRPILRDIAAQRLATYRTIDMNAEPRAARAVLGERAWEFLMPPAREAGRDERTVALADLRATVELLEKLHDDDNADD